MKKGGLEMKKFKSEEGWALVSIFIVMVIILSLTTVLIYISLTDFRQAERNKNDTKAYLLARSGAEIVANWIIKNNITFASNKNEK